MAETSEATGTGIETIKDALLFVVRAIPTSHQLLADLERVIGEHFGDGEPPAQDQAPAQDPAPDPAQDPNLTSAG